MKKYAVAILSLFENENNIFIVQAEDEFKALVEALVESCKEEINKEDTRKWALESNNLDQLITACYNIDLCVSKPILI